MNFLKSRGEGEEAALVSQRGGGCFGISNVHIHILRKKIRFLGVYHFKMPLWKSCIYLFKSSLSFLRKSVLFFFKEKLKVAHKYEYNAYKVQSRPTDQFFPSLLETRLLLRGKGPYEVKVGRPVEKVFLPLLETSWPMIVSEKESTWTIEEVDWRWRLLFPFPGNWLACGTCVDAWRGADRPECQLPI